MRAPFLWSPLLLAACVTVSVRAQDSPSGTGPEDARTAITTSALRSGRVSTQLGDGLYSSKLGAAGADIARVSMFGSSAEERTGWASAKRLAQAMLPFTVPTNSVNNISTNAPQTQGQGMIPEGSRTTQGRQARPQPPTEGRRLGP